MPLINKLAKPAYRLLNGALGAIRRQQSRRIPRIELSPGHIGNLRVLIDREALLQWLPKGGVVAEAGVDHGDFSARILEVTKPSKLHLIDAWHSERYHDGLQRHVSDRFAGQIASGLVELNRGLSTVMLSQFPDAHFDWIYIDTDHSYTTTRDELEIARRKVRPSGIIAGHDFITGNWDGGVRYGVVEAVHEFCVRHHWELIALTHETDRHLSFAIRALHQGKDP